MDPNTWWPGWRPTPAEHRPANPDAWRRRLSSHVDEGLRRLGRHSHEAATITQFIDDLDTAYLTFRDSTDADRTNQFLEQISTIGARAFTYFTACENPILGPQIDGLRFDLAGLAEVLADEQPAQQTHELQPTEAT
jgi:hypothetical protein